MFPATHNQGPPSKFFPRNQQFQNSSRDGRGAEIFPWIATVYNHSQPFNRYGCPFLQKNFFPDTKTPTNYCFCTETCRFFNFELVIVVSSRALSSFRFSSLTNFSFSFSFAVICLLLFLPLWLQYQHCNHLHFYFFLVYIILHPKLPIFAV